MKRAVIVGLVLAGTTAVAGCGGDDMKGMDHGSSASSPSSPNAQSASHNDQDVMFAQQMIPHHRQAVEMARLASSRTENPEVKTLATQIEGAQDPEITAMTGWLKEWGAALPEDGMPGMDHGGAGMPGMMTDADMMSLTKASGAGFDRMFLTMMIKHHEGAIAMAKEEQSKGSSAPAETLAGSIITGQTAEISTMRGLLR
ncbi:MAG: DUF305 domain-containing protein [Streptosporangiaceae bacterium]